MALTITSIRVDSITIEWNDGKIKITGNYSLMTDKNATLIKQSFNGYSDAKIDFSKDTTIVANELLDSIQDDLELEVGVRDLVRTAVKELKGGKDAGSEEQSSTDSEGK